MPDDRLADMELAVAPVREQPPSEATQARCAASLPLCGVWAVTFWAASILVLQAMQFQRRLDLTDESFSLQLTVDPNATRPAGEIFLFQFLLNPLLRVVGYDIAAFRLAGLLLLAAVAWGATAASWRVLRTSGIAVPNRVRVLQVATVLAACTTLYGFAAPSLTYRGVEFIGLWFVAIGVSLSISGRPIMGGLVSGAALVIVFTGRPTSAAAAAVPIVIVAAVGGAPMGRVIPGGFAGGTMAGLTLCLLGGMSPVELVQYLARGYGQESAGGSHTSWLTMLGVVPSPLTALIIFGPLIVLPVVAIAVMNRNSGATPRLLTSAAFSGLPLAGLVTYLGLSWLTPRGFGAQILTLTLALFALVVLFTVWAAAVHPVTVSADQRAPWALVMLLVLLPYLAPLGTNTQYSYNMAQVCAFWVLALFVVLSLLRTRVSGVGWFWLPAAVSALSVSSCVFVLWAAAGGKDQSVLASTSPVRVLGGELLVTPDEAAVLNDLSRVREHYGTQGEPSIDLTGFGGGYLLQLGTRPLGRASFFGFFEGAANGAAEALSHESCHDRARAWVLHADDNPLDVTEGFTAGTGIDLEHDYEEILSFHPVQGPAEWRGLTVRLLRPTTTVAQALGCAGSS